MIGVLTGTGGISDIVRNVIVACAKETGARLPARKGLMPAPNNTSLWGNGMAETPTLTFFGDAETVTGSKYLVRAGERRVLLDCGMFQGMECASGS